MRKTLVMLTLIVVGLLTGCSGSMPGRASSFTSDPNYQYYHGSSSGDF